MINKQQILIKMDKVVEIYFTSKKIDGDKCFRTMLVNRVPEIQIFSSILDLSEATGLDMIETTRERIIEYKGVRFFELRDLEKEIMELKNQLKG